MKAVISPSWNSFDVILRSKPPITATADTFEPVSTPRSTGASMDKVCHTMRPPTSTSIRGHKLQMFTSRKPSLLPSITPPTMIQILPPTMPAADFAWVMRARPIATSTAGQYRR